MTVQELIDKLSEMPREALVLVTWGLQLQSNIEVNASKAFQTHSHWAWMELDPDADDEDDDKEVEIVDAAIFGFC